nr:MAG TPA: hypothetical protein [Caudoviricetes sp.]
MTSLFETEHAQLARRLADKLGGVYPKEQLGCEILANKARILVKEPNEKHSRWRIFIDATERGLVAGMLLRTEDGQPETPLIDGTPAELEAAINKLIEGKTA